MCHCIGLKKFLAKIVFIVLLQNISLCFCLLRYDPVKFELNIMIVSHFISLAHYGFLVMVIPFKYLIHHHKFAYPGVKSDLAQSSR